MQEHEINDSLTDNEPKDEVITAEGLIAQAEEELEAADAEPPNGTNQTPGQAANAETQEQKEHREKLEKMIASWPEEDKKLFASAPENLRDLLGKYYHLFQADHTKKTQQAAAMRAELEAEWAELRPVVTGRFQNMQEFASFVSDARRFEEEFMRNPLRTLSMLAQQAGISLQQLQEYQPDPAQEAVRPIEAKLEQLQHLLSRQNSPAAPNAQPQDKPWEKALEDFADAVDDKGNKTHPYFAEVAPVMGYIMRRDGHEDMEKAYREAIYSLPKAREELLKQERQQAAQQQAEVEKAKKAAQLRSRTNTAPHAGGNKIKKIDDIIALAEEELAGQ